MDSKDHLDGKTKTSPRTRLLVPSVTLTFTPWLFLRPLSLLHFSRNTAWSCDHHACPTLPWGHAASAGVFL